MDHFCVIIIMLRRLNLTLLVVAVLMLSACEKPTSDATHEKQDTLLDAVEAERVAEQPLLTSTTEQTIPESAFKTVEWTDLMPEEDLEALLNPPSYVTDVEDGSLEDQISSQIQNTIAAASDDRYQQALTSTRIIPAMNEKAIRIAGFIVPLEFDDEQTITQFFLVPFFGACIHVPPPPPNQIIFVNYPKGLKLDALYDPFWISGILKTSFIENEMAIAAYSMQMHFSEVYTE